MSGLHDNRCASHTGHPCNCPSAALVGNPEPVCAACGSRKLGQHTMGCPVGIAREAALTAQTEASRREREAALLCNVRAPLWVLQAVRDAVNGADAVAERQRREAQQEGAT